MMNNAGPNSPPSMSPDELEANYSKAMAAEQMLGVARSQLDKLAALGANVSMDDLVKSGAKLVAGGLDPTAVASMLADAPSGSSELLAEWVTQQDLMLHQREAQLKLATRDLKYHMGIAGMHMLAQGTAQSAGALGPQGALTAPSAPSSALGGPNG